MIRLDLTEYETIEARIPAESALALAAAAGSALAVAPAFTKGDFRITATSHVGTVVAGGVEVRIRPKVPVDNVLYLLTSRWRRPWLRPDLVSYESSEVTAAFVALFADAVTHLLRRGPQHDYVEHAEPLDTIRGRIDLTGQFRRPGRLVPVDCIFSEFTLDTGVNRYLKHALRMASRAPGVWRRTKTQLRHAVAALDRVSDVPPAANLPLRMHYTRLTGAYEPVLRLAHVIRTRVGLGDVRGSTHASSFLLDMNEVFERFVEDSLRLHLASELVVEGQVTDHLDQDEKVPIRPDLLFRDETGQPVYIGDVKYKVSSDGMGRAADYYQLHAYCTRFGLPEGVLIYATIDEGAQLPMSVTTISDEIRLRALRFPLRGSLASVRAIEAEVADDILSRTIRALAIAR